MIKVFDDFRLSSPSDFSKDSEGTNKKARGFFFWILATHIHIKAIVKKKNWQNPLDK